jgi:hypothetical protein
LLSDGIISILSTIEGLGRWIIEIFMMSCRLMNLKHGNFAQKNFGVWFLVFLALSKGSKAAGSGAL